MASVCLVSITKIFGIDVMYNPDTWVIIKFKGDDPHYRVLGGWSGGYLNGDSWRLNSGIVRHEFDGDYWYFYGSSGSCYKCYLDSYGLRMSIAGIWNKLKEVHGDKVELVEDQAWIVKDWDWIIK
jgi:hypothetical protein